METGNIEVVGKYTFADLPKEIRMVIFKDGLVYYNLKYKDKILKEFMG